MNFIVNSFQIINKYYCETILKEINIYECFGIARTHAQNTALHKMNR